MNTVKELKEVLNELDDDYVVLVNLDGSESATPCLLSTDYTTLRVKLRAGEFSPQEGGVPNAAVLWASRW